MRLKHLLVSGGLSLFTVASVLGVPLRVQVRDSETSTPVRAVVVAVGAFPKVISGLTDSTGAVTLDLPTLDRVGVSIRSETHGTKCVAPEQVKTGSVTVVLSPSIRVYGVVTDQTGAGVSGAAVKAVYPKQSECAVVFEFGMPPERTNERGEYVIRNVDLERNPVLEFQHPALKEARIDKTAFNQAERLQRRKELNIRLDRK